MNNKEHDDNNTAMTATVAMTATDGNDNNNGYDQHNDHTMTLITQTQNNSQKHTQIIHIKMKEERSWAYLC